MATGYVLLPMNTWFAATSNPPGMSVVNSIPRWQFDPTTPEALFAEFILPGDYASAPVLQIFYGMAGSGSGTIEFEVSIMAATDGDSASLDTDSYDTVNSGSDSLSTGPHYPHNLTVTLTNNDSMAAGDLVRIKIERDADDGVNDTFASDLEFHGARLDYTTT